MKLTLSKPNLLMERRLFTSAVTLSGLLTRRHGRWTHQCSFIKHVIIKNYTPATLPHRGDDDEGDSPPPESLNSCLITNTCAIDTPIMPAASMSAHTTDRRPVLTLRARCSASRAL